MRAASKVVAFVAAATVFVAPAANASQDATIVPMWDPGDAKHDLNNATIVDAKPVYDNGDTIRVTATHLKPNTKYVAGQCQMEANTTFWVFELPGCVGTNQVTVWTDNNGSLDFEFQVVNKGRNVHARVPVHGGDKELIFYPDEQGGTPLKSDAEIVIVQDHGKGFRGTQVADTAQTFRVNKG